MELPDDLLLSQVQPANIHRDKKSLERAILYKRIIKSKYKLAGNRIEPLSLFTFFVLTKNKDACRRDLKIRICQTDWEEKDANCLNEKYSYTDLTKSEVMGKHEILAKIKDRDNGFKCVAKLCAKKYQKLQSLLPLMRTAQRRPLERQVEIAELSLSKVTTETATDVLRRLGLA